MRERKRVTKGRDIPMKSLTRERRDITRELRKATRIRKDIRGWIGWDYIEKIAELSDDPTLILALFLTGGRATEILELFRYHFADMGTYYEVRAMPVFKKFEVVGKYVDEQGNNRWRTKLYWEPRTFPILKIHDLANAFWDGIEDREGRLFTFPRFKNQYWQVYKTVSKIETPPNPLAPMNEKGEYRNLYPHWFRGMRAAQLRVEYNLSVDRLMDFFRWRDPEMALHYAGLSVADMAVAMQQGLRYTEVWQKILGESSSI